jgi:glutamate 5-kinase
MIRDTLKNAELIVVKIGSKVLLEDNGRPHYPRIAHLVEQIAHLHQGGKKVVFVSSGAIGAGMEALSLNKRPTDLPTLQAAAAIGQVRLMRAYEDLFGSYGCIVAQVLLTHDDLKHRVRHINSKNTLLALLSRGVIPIINENDTVSVNEIKFGDNDVLASLVAMLLEAKALILLTTADGFMIKNKDGEKECLPHIFEINEDLLKHIEAHKAGLSSGGMKSKLQAAANMIHVGGVAVIAPGLRPDVLGNLFSGAHIGTIIGAHSPEQAQKMPGRKRWIAFYHRSLGGVLVDEGAQEALIKKGKSLLPVGITAVHGDFHVGSVIEIRDFHGKAFAKGISQMASTEIKRLQGKPSDSEEILEVVHRDDLVILSETHSL